MTGRPRSVIEVRQWPTAIRQGCRPRQHGTKRRVRAALLQRYHNWASTTSTGTPLPNPESSTLMQPCRWRASAAACQGLLVTKAAGQCLRSD